MEDGKKRGEFRELSRKGHPNVECGLGSFRPAATAARRIEDEDEHDEGRVRGAGMMTRYAGKRSSQRDEPANQ
jgi:hypothetical protein